MGTAELLFSIDDKFYELGIAQMRAEREEAPFRQMIIRAEMNALIVVNHAVNLIQRINKG